MLIVALMLSALNAIMGCARSLHQMSVDGQFPRFFQQHRTSTACRPARWSSTSSCSLLVVLLGGAVEIYTFSNVGYTGSFLTGAVAYYLLRKYRPNVARPVPPAGVLQVRRARAWRRPVRVHLAVRRDLLRAHRQHRDLLLPRLGGGARSTSRSTCTGRGSRTSGSPEPDGAGRVMPHGARRRRSEPRIAGRRAAAPRMPRARSRHACGARGAARLRGPRRSHRGDRPRRADRRALGRAGARVRHRAHLGHELRLPQPGADADQARVGRAAHAASSKAVGRLRAARACEARRAASRHARGGQADRRGGASASAATRS